MSGIPGFRVEIGTDTIKKRIYLISPSCAEKVYLKWSGLQPKELIEIAMEVIVLLEKRYPHMKGKFWFDPQTLKNQFYNAKRALTWVPPVATTPGAFPPKLTGYGQRFHSCTDHSAFEKEKDIRTRGGFDQVEKIPDRIGELIGFRGWVPNQHHLTSNGAFIWEPGKPSEAICTNNGCTIIPCITCSCGLYAANEKVMAIHQIRGRVKLWGRFLRGEKGIRAQIGYPLDFTITEDQMQWFEMLKTYNVPIFTEVTRIELLTLFDPNEGKGDNPWKLEE